MPARDVPLGALPDPALVVDASGAIVARNDAARERWDDTFTSLSDVVADGTVVESIRANLGESIETDGEGPTGDAETLDVGHEAIWDGECHLVDDRHRFPAAVSVRSIGPDRVLLVARDRTDERRDERDAALLDTLLSEIPVSVYFKDRESRHVRVSNNLAADLRENEDGVVVHTPGDVEGKTEYDLYPADIAEPAVADDERVMATGEAIEGLVERVERPNGEIVYITTSKAPWYDADGTVVGIVGVSVETTAQKRQAEELKRQNERLEAFASAVSHDLRNPLEVARANLELYDETDDPSTLSTVERMHDRMSQLIDDTLELARGGEPVTDPEPVDVETVVDRAWNAVETADGTLTCGLDGTVAADRSRLARLLENCFRNAIEHAGDDTSVRVVELADGSGFAIEDDGPGIPADERDTVFDRGYSTGEGGTGFGLSIVAEIADAHGWTLRVSEAEDGGARFEFVTDPAE